MGADAIFAVVCHGVGNRVVGDYGSEIRTRPVIGRADVDASSGRTAVVINNVAVDLNVLNGAHAAHQCLNAIVQTRAWHGNSVVEDFRREAAGVGAAQEGRDRGPDTRSIAAHRIVGNFRGDMSGAGLPDQDAVVVVVERVGVASGADGVDGQSRAVCPGALETGGLVAGERRVLQIRGRDRGVTQLEQHARTVRGVVHVELGQRAAVVEDRDASLERTADQRVVDSGLGGAADRAPGQAGVVGVGLEAETDGAFLGRIAVRGEAVPVRHEAVHG